MASPLPSSSRKTKKLGEILVEEGLITAEQLERALLEQSRTDQLLGRILIDLKMVKESDLMAALAKQIGFRFVDLNEFTIDGSASGLIPEQVARRYRALPIGYEDSRLLVAMADPANLFALDDIRTMTGMALQPVVATAADIESAIRKYSRMDESVQKMASEASTAAEDEVADLERAAASLEEGPIVKMVNLLISQAIADRASDIHIEPMEREVRIRYRIDGVLSEVMRSPKNIQAGLISRLKVMADINIAERRVPQDGRIGLTVGGKSIDLRLATLPTLYATLNIVNKADRNIITVEDPVEYRLPGVNQMQMNVRAGLTFASALRSILRADPDVVLVGEIRDHETALIAIEAALTGHLVLSTLHTNDAPSSLPRLVEMGVETYLVASAIDCVVAQRLARKLCPKCREGYRPNQSELEQAGFPEFMWDDVKELFRPVGCTACSKTGFRGRLGMYEVMNMSEEIERLVVERAPSEEIRRSARRDRMITLREDGLEKVRLGITSVEEVLRVVS